MLQEPTQPGPDRFVPGGIPRHSDFCTVESVNVRIAESALG